MRANLKAQLNWILSAVVFLTLFEMAPQVKSLCYWEVPTVISVLSTWETLKQLEVLIVHNTNNLDSLNLILS